MWVRFVADFDWKPKPSVTIGYRTGMALNVTTACGTAAVAAGRAVRAKKIGRDVPIEDLGDDDSRSA